MDRLTIITQDGDIYYQVKSDPEGEYDILDLAKEAYDGDGEEAQILLNISKRLAYYEEQRSWISVNKRLPECVKGFKHSKVVWCLDAHGKTGFAIYQKELRNEGWFTGGDVGENSVRITHWMSIPEEPIAPCTRGGI